MACLFLCCLLDSGCGYRNYPAPRMEPVLPASVQAEAIGLVQQFVGDLNRKDYAAADKMVAPALRPDWSPKNVQHHLAHDGYWMLAGSHDWVYNQVQSLKHGQEVVVHAQFHNDPNDMLYHTNFSFAKQGGSWTIDFILNPVQKQRLQKVNIPLPKPGGRGQH